MTIFFPLLIACLRHLHVFTVDLDLRIAACLNSRQAFLGRLAATLQVYDAIVCLFFRHNLPTENLAENVPFERFKNFQIYTPYAPVIWALTIWPLSNSISCLILLLYLVLAVRW